MIKGMFNNGSTLTRRNKKMTNQVQPYKEDGFPVCEYSTVDQVAECMEGVVKVEGLYEALWSALGKAGPEKINADGFEDWEDKLDRTSVSALWEHFNNDQRTKLNEIIEADYATRYTIGAA
jgi:hypothetical protein